MCDKSKRDHRLGRMDFIRRIVAFDETNGTIECILEPDPRRYEKMQIDGEVAYKDKFTQAIIRQSVLKSMAERAVDVPLYYAPHKHQDPCSYLRERKLKLIEHWDDKYILNERQAPLLETLRNMRGSEAEIVVLYVDMEGSTKISAEVDPQLNQKIVKIFLMQMSKAIDTCNGYVYKYVGDCVIGIFLADTNFTGMSDNAIQAAMMMRQLVEDVINPVFAEKGLPQIGCHIGLDIGKVPIQACGAQDVAAFDELIGYTMNVTGKIVARAGHNEILLGRGLFEVIHVHWQERCQEASLRNWSITDPALGGIYRLYTFISKWSCKDEI